MTKIRGSTLLQMAGGAVPMSQLGAQGFYLRKNVAWGKKPMVIANLPYTIESPTEAQLEQRSRFGHFAQENRGKGFVNGLPRVAGLMKKHEFGMTTAPHRGKRVRRTFYTLEEIDRMLAARGKVEEIPIEIMAGERVYPRRRYRY